MASKNGGDRSADIAWTIIKVIVSLIRFWIGGLCTIAFFGSLFAIDGSGYSVIRPFLLALAAFLIWPQKYGPPTKLIEMYQVKESKGR